MRLRSLLLVLLVVPLATSCDSGGGVAEIIDRTRSTVSSSASTVSADGSSTVSITVVALDFAGQPVAGIRLTFSASGSANTWSATEVVTGSDGSARAELSSTSAETKTISVDVANGSLQQRLASQVSVEFLAVPLTISAAVSTVVASPSTGVVANGVATAAISVTVLSAAAVPIAGARVDLSTTGATLVPTSAISAADGTVTAAVTATVAGTKTITVQVTPAGGGTMVQLNTQPTVGFIGNAATIDATNSTVSATPTSGVLADGVATSTITVTVKDSLGNPVPGQTVTLAATGSGNSIFQPVWATDASGQASGLLSSTVGELKTVSATVNPSGTPVAIVQTVAVTFQSTGLDNDDAKLIYGESTVLNPVRHRNWDDSISTWSAEASVIQISAQLQWSVTRISPGATPVQIAATLTDNGASTTLQVYRLISSAWTAQWSAAAITSANSAKQGFDLEFEQSSGHAMVVYSDNSSTPQYRTFDGTNWSAAAALPLNDGGGANPDPNTGIVTWVELVNRPGSDELALVYADANQDLVALVWSGVAWTTASAVTLETGLKTNPDSGAVSNRAFDGAFEGSSGDLLVCWAKAGSNGFQYSLKAAGGSSWSVAVGVTSAPASVPHFIDLAGQPGADRIAGVFSGLGDGTERIGMATWTGSSWSHAGEYDSQIRNVNNKSAGDHPAAVAWLGSTAVAICVYSDHATGVLDWAKWDSSNGWVLQTDIVVTGKGFTESVQAQGFGAQGAAMVVLTDSNFDLYTFTFDGSVWSSALVLETSMAVIDAVPFGFSIRGARHN